MRERRRERGVNAETLGEIEKPVKSETDLDNHNICYKHYETLKQLRNTIRRKRDQHVRNQINTFKESIDSNHFWGKHSEQT